MICLAFDVGRVRVGVAATDESGTIATPLVTLQRQKPAHLWDSLRTEISKRGVDTLVVGLPLRLDGTGGDAVDDARAFGTQAEAELGMTVQYWDERFSSQAAERALISTGMRRKQRREVADSVAACLILQSWLDASSRVRHA